MSALLVTLAVIAALLVVAVMAWRRSQLDHDDIGDVFTFGADVATYRDCPIFAETVAATGCFEVVEFAARVEGAS